MPRSQGHGRRETPPVGATAHSSLDVLDHDFVAPIEDEPADPGSLGPDLAKLLLSLAAKSQ
jgi:hypothetical protein